MSPAKLCEPSQTPCLACPGLLSSSNWLPALPPTHPPSDHHHTPRLASPTLYTPPTQATKAFWSTAVGDYCANKCRALYGSSFRYE